MVSMFSLSVKLGLEVSLHLNISTRLFTNRSSYKFHIYIYNLCAHGQLRVCVRARVFNISLSASHVTRIRKEISNCMETIRRLRHWFVM